jgi:hypothetical protein
VSPMLMFGPQEVMWKFLQNVDMYGCPLDCKGSSFNPRILYFDNDNNVNGEFMLFPYYETATVEKKVEHLVYDFITLSSTIGGTLGLLLGSSLLSIILTCIKWSLQ